MQHQGESFKPDVARPDCLVFYNLEQKNTKGVIRESPSLSPSNSTAVSKMALSTTPSTPLGRLPRRKKALVIFILAILINSKGRGWHVGGETNELKRQFGDDVDDMSLDDDALLEVLSRIVQY